MHDQMNHDPTTVIFGSKYPRDLRDMDVIDLSDKLAPFSDLFPPVPAIFRPSAKHRRPRRFH